MGINSPRPPLRPLRTSPMRRGSQPGESGPPPERAVGRVGRRRVVLYPQRREARTRGRAGGAHGALRAERGRVGSDDQARIPAEARVCVSDSLMSGSYYRGCRTGKPPKGLIPPT